MTCGQCKHFTGAGDWNLCCDIKHPTPKEKEQGLDFSWGHLCYEDTEACDAFEDKVIGIQRNVKIRDLQTRALQRKHSRPNSKTREDLAIEESYFKDMQADLYAQIVEEKEDETYKENEI